jgi:hypothetical protein
LTRCWPKPLRPDASAWRGPRVRPRRACTSRSPLRGRPDRRAGRRRTAASPRARVTITAAAAAGLTAALAAGMLAATTAGPHGSAVHHAPAAARPATPSVQTVAYRTFTALSGAATNGILYIDTTFPAGTVASNPVTVRAWVRGMADREQELGPGGTLITDASAVLSDGMRVRRFVDYSSRTWQTDSIALSQYGPEPSLRTAVEAILGPPGSAPGTSSPPEPQRTITRVTVAGHPLIKITATWPAHSAGYDRPVLFIGPEFAPGSELGIGPTGQRTLPVSETMWIDPATYLPTRIQTTGPGGQVQLSQAVSVLPDTEANLAELVPAPVPAGFRLTSELGH